jgi:hypothetical protein
MPSVKIFGYSTGIVFQGVSFFLHTNLMCLTCRDRDLVFELLHTVEYEAVQQHRHRRLKRRRFWAAGVNDVWPQDQHDKWGRFGIWLHASLEAFSGEINWLRVWWTNKNPKLITSYFRALYTNPPIPVESTGIP